MNIISVSRCLSLLRLILVKLTSETNLPDEEYIDIVGISSSLRGRRLRVVVVMFRMRDRRDRGQPLRAAHGPAERAALSARAAGQTHRQQAPTSHRPERRRLRDCRHKTLVFLFQNYFSFFFSVFFTASEVRSRGFITA